MTISTIPNIQIYLNVAEKLGKLEDIKPGCLLIPSTLGALYFVLTEGFNKGTDQSHILYFRLLALAHVMPELQGQYVTSIWMSDPTKWYVIKPHENR